MSAYSLFEVQQAIDYIFIRDLTLLQLLDPDIVSFDETDGLFDSKDGLFDGNSSDVRIYESPIKYEGMNYPYIAYTSNTALPWNTKTENGMDVTITLSVFSRTGSRKECATILSRIYDLLHDASLTLENNSSIFCLHDGLTEIIRNDNDEGILYQGVIRFRILTQGV